MTKINKLFISPLLVGILLGVIGFIAFRFATYKSITVHHHANFALYVEGEHVKFDNFTFYEEVQACSGSQDDNPKNRVHMHNQTPHVIHVHDGGSTWSHFFANLGYGLTNSSLETDDEVYVDGAGGNELTFTLNGEVIESIANRAINSEDTLLINYGADQAEVLSQRYDAIRKDAKEYNTKPDPAGCSGSESMTTWDRLKASMGIETDKH